MRALVVVLVDKRIETGLLLEDVGAGGFRRGLLKGEMHSLMPSILLGMAGLDPLESDAESQPPHGEFTEAVERGRTGEGNATGQRREM